MTPKTLIIDLQYLPCTAYFETLLQYEKIVLDIHENYEKQSYRNRCYIQLANKTEALSIPIIKGNSKQMMKEVKIDHGQKWQQVHWRGIHSAYGKSAFFEYYADYFEKVFNRKHDYLVDFNMELLTLCLKFSQIDIKPVFSEKYLPREDENPDFKDLRSAIHPKKGFAPNSQNDTKPYQQVFGMGFVENLSVIDLLFCEGANSINILKRKDKM